MRNLLSAAVIFFAVIFQTTFAPKFGVFGAAPNLIFLAIFTLFFLRNLDEPSGGLRSLKEGAAFAILGGFFSDIFSSQSFGAAIIAFSLTIALIFILLEKIFDKKNYKSMLAAVFFGAIFYNAVILFFLKMSGSADLLTIGSVFWRFVLKEAVLDAVLAMIIFTFIHKFFGLWVLKTPRTILRNIS